MFLSISYVFGMMYEIKIVQEFYQCGRTSLLFKIVVLSDGFGSKG